MAYASAVEISPTSVSRTGTDITTLATTPTATHGNKFWNNGKTYLEIYNGSGGAVVATFNTPGQVAGLDIAELTLSVAGSKRNVIGPFTADFNQADGYVWVTFDAVTDVKIQAYTF